jgi:hypothetical protein
MVQKLVPAVGVCTETAWFKNWCQLLVCTETAWLKNWCQLLVRALKQHGSKTGAQNHWDIGAPRQCFLNV